MVVATAAAAAAAAAAATAASEKQYPADPFTILGLHDQKICEYYAVQERRTTELEAPKL